MGCTSLGPYTLTRVLGRGGFGTVWLAEDACLGAQAAVKVHPSGGRALARLHREYLLLNAIDHPAIPTPLRLGSLDGGGGWLALDLALGGSATSFAATLGAPGDAARTSRSVGVVIDVLDAVDALHERALIHADLKSSNLRVDDAGRVALLDLGGTQHAGGLSKLSLGRLSTSTSAAIEQLVDVPIDPRADLHAVGVIAYGMLVGRRPFQLGGDAVGDRVRRRFHPPHVAVPGIEKALSIAVMRMLALSPADRPATAREAASTLRALGYRGVGWATVDTTTPPESEAPDPWLAEVIALRRRGALSAADRRLDEVGPPTTVGRAIERALLDVWLGRSRVARRRASSLLGSSRAVDAACVLARASQTSAPMAALRVLSQLQVRDAFDRARLDAWSARLLAPEDSEAAEDLAFAAHVGLRSDRSDVRSDVSAALQLVLPVLAPKVSPRRPDACLDRLDQLVAGLAGALAGSDLARAKERLLAARRLASWVARGLSPDDQAAWALHLTTMGVW